MALASSTMLKFGGHHNRFSNTMFDTRPKVLPNNHKGIFLLNRDTPNGETTTAANARAAKNRVPGADQGPETISYPGNRPDAFNGFWRSNVTGVTPNIIQSPLLTALVETAALCMIFVARSKSTNLAADPAARAYMGGNFANNALRGTGLIFNGPVQIRAVAYDAVDGAKTADLAIPAGSVDKWRIYCLKRESTVGGLLSVENWSGDSVINEPAGTPLPNGPDLGTGRSNIFLLGRIGGEYSEECDVALVHILDTIPSAGDKTDLLVQIRQQMLLAGIEELGLTPDP